MILILDIIHVNNKKLIILCTYKIGIKDERTRSFYTVQDIKFKMLLDTAFTADLKERNLKSSVLSVLRY